MASRAVVLLLIATVAAIVAIGDAQSTIGASTAALTTLSKERLVLQTEHGDLHLAFYAKVETERAAQSRGAVGSGFRRCRPPAAEPPPARSRTAAARPPVCPPAPILQAAPKTVEHIKRCGELGLYNTNHFFRVDKGFVAQTADILGGRSAPMNKMQREVASRHVPLEVHADVKHDKRGILSMAKGDGGCRSPGAVPCRCQPCHALDSPLPAVSAELF